MQNSSTLSEESFKNYLLYDNKKYFAVRSNKIA